MNGCSVQAEAKLVPATIHFQEGVASIGLSLDLNRWQRNSNADQGLPEGLRLEAADCAMNLLQELRSLKPPTESFMHACAGVHCAVSHRQHVAGHDHAAAAHASLAAALQRQRMGVAARGAVHSGSLLWAPGRCVPPHRRHPRVPPPVLCDAALPRTGALLF